LFERSRFNEFETWNALQDSVAGLVSRRPRIAKAVNAVSPQPALQQQQTELVQ
jgi:hypothetical protein